MCRAIDGPDGPDCLVAVMEAQGRIEPADCEEVPVGVWRDECVFLYAERAAKAGRLKEGLDACGRIGFGRECSFHLIREGARAVLDRPVTEAGGATSAYAGLPFAPDADRLFWKTWFRERLEGKVPLDPTGCPTEACFAGARQTLLLTLNGIARAAGPAFCDGSVPDGKAGPRTLWEQTAETDAWVREYIDGECARREGRRRGPGGPAGPAGGGPPMPGMGGGVVPQLDGKGVPSPAGSKPAEPASATVPPAP